MLAGSDLGRDGLDFVGSIFGNEEVGGLADDLLAGVAEDPLGGWVPAGDGVVDAPADDGIVRMLDDRCHALGGLERLSLFGHVAMDPRNADYRAVLVADRRDGDRDGDHSSVLSDKRGLKMRYSLAIPDPGQYGAHLAGSIFGNQEAARPADDLRSEEHTSELQSRQYLVC